MTPDQALDLLARRIEVEGIDVRGMDLERDLDEAADREAAERYRQGRDE